MNPRYDDVKLTDIACGTSALLVEMVFFFVIVIFVKWLYADLSILAILFCRYLFCLPLLFVYGGVQRRRQLLNITNVDGLIKLIVAGLIGLGAWYFAIALIDVSLATALSQIMPIFITILAPFILAEKVGLRSITAIIIGFIGVFILLNPTDLLNLALDNRDWDNRDWSNFGWGVMFAILAPLFAGLAFIYLRLLGRSEAPVSMVLWYNITGVVVIGIIGSVVDDSILVLYDGFLIGGFSANIMLMLVAIGVLASFQQFLVALSHTFAPASILAPVHYFSIPMGVATGIIFFGEEITWYFVIGTLIIIGANYYILLRERSQISS